MRNKETRKVVKTYIINKEDLYWFRAALRRVKSVQCDHETPVQAGRPINVYGSIDALEEFELEWL